MCERKCLYRSVCTSPRALCLTIVSTIKYHGRTRLQYSSLSGYEAKCRVDHKNYIFHMNSCHSNNVPRRSPRRGSFSATATTCHRDLPDEVHFLPQQQRARMSSQTRFIFCYRNNVPQRFPRRGSFSTTATHCHRDLADSVHNLPQQKRATEISQTRFIFCHSNNVPECPPRLGSFSATETTFHNDLPDSVHFFINNVPQRSPRLGSFSATEKTCHRDLPDSIYFQTQKQLATEISQTRFIFCHGNNARHRNLPN
jgi:hypothetical protein